MARFLPRRRTGTDEITRREAALFEFSRRLVGAGAVGEVAQGLFRAVDDLFTIDQCMLLTVNEEQTRAVCVATMAGMSPDVASISIDLEEDTSAVAQVVRDRAPHRVYDGQRESLQQKAIAEALNIRSALYVPLQTSAGVIAVAVFASETVRAFRRDEVEFIHKLANDAAVAIERARLAQTLREVGERELIVAAVARTIRETIEPDELLLTAARELGEQTDSDMTTVAMVPSEELDGRMCRWTLEAHEVAAFDFARLSATTRLAVTDRQVVTARAGGEASTATAVAIPLIHRDRLHGVLSLERPHQPFEPSEVRLIELIGVEIAAAIEYMRLHHGGRQHLDEQLALARAAQALTADLRFDRVLERIVDEVVKLLHTTSAAFYTYDRDARLLTLSAAFGETERRAIGQTMGLVGLAGRVITSGVSQVTNDYESELAGEFHPAFQGVRRAISVPVRWQGDVRGVVSVAARDMTRKFTSHDVALIEAFADLASLALHNAEAYTANSRQARIQAGFYRISQVLSSSLSRSQTLAALAQAATEALDGDWSVVIGGDDAEDELHVESSWLAPEDVTEQLSTPERLSDSLATLALAHRRVVTSRDVTGDDRVGESWRALLSGAGINSQLAIPVSVHGRHSAVVLVCYERPMKFGDEELVVAGNLANAASAALERAGLFENERRTRRLAEVLADVSALLAETLKAQTVLERIVDQAAVLLEVDACSLAVAPRSTSLAAIDERDVPELHVRAASGNDQELVDRLVAAPVGELVEEVARSKRSVSVRELASETSGQALPGGAYDSFLGVPLRHPRGHLIGVLSACSRKHRVWSAAEVASLESFANSAAIAIRNAELYTEARRERDTVEKLLASIAEGIAATDAEGRITMWNSAAEQITGVTADQVISRNWRDVLGLAGDVVVEDGTSVIEARPSGIPMWLSITAARLLERGGESGAIYAFRDVSADHTLDRIKSDFVSTVSYMLRTPLTSIYGFADTLLREDLSISPEDQTVFLQYIATESERLTSIVDDLLLVARIDSGSVDVTVAECDLEKIVRSAIDAADLAATGCDVVLDVIENMTVRADAEKLQVVIGNLLDNVVRTATELGRVEVTIAPSETGATVRVTDPSTTLAPSEQHHLFARFFVAPAPASASSVRRRGAGLGLYVGKGLVDAMGGSLDVSSRPDMGTSFTIELPRAPQRSSSIEQQGVVAQ